MHIEAGNQSKGAGIGTEGSKAGPQRGKWVKGREGRTPWKWTGKQGNGKADGRSREQESQPCTKRKQQREHKPRAPQERALHDLGSVASLLEPRLPHPSSGDRRPSVRLAEERVDRSIL